jgi:tyrosyl-tRNA synthetase
MMNFASDFLRDLDARGFLYQCTAPEALDELCCGSEKLTFYIGFDPTAKSLHVGHLLWIKLVEKLQSSGHSPIILCGGATSKIGDPTWKDNQRVMLSDETISENTASILGKLSQLIQFEDQWRSSSLGMLRLTDCRGHKVQLFLIVEFPGVY